MLQSPIKCVTINKHLYYAYRIVLGLLGVMILLALLVYLRIEEARPGVADSG